MPAVPVIVRLGNVVDPLGVQSNVAVAGLLLMKPPVPLKDNPVDAILNTVVAAVVLVNSILLVPKTIEREPALVELNIPHDAVKLFKSKVPRIRRRVEVTGTVSALPNVNVPAPFNESWGTSIVVPFVVIVTGLVALNIMLLDELYAVPAIKDILPDIVRVAIPVNVYVPADTVMSKQAKELEVVTV